MLPGRYASGYRSSGRIVSIYAASATLISPPTAATRAIWASGIPRLSLGSVFSMPKSAYTGFAAIDRATTTKMQSAARMTPCCVRRCFRSNHSHATRQSPVAASMYVPLFLVKVARRANAMKAKSHHFPRRVTRPFASTKSPSNTVSMTIEAENAGSFQRAMLNVA